MPRRPLLHDQKTRGKIVIPANRVGWVLAPILAFSVSIGSYAIVQGLGGLTSGGLSVPVRRAGDFNLSGLPAQVCGTGLILLGLGFAPLPLGIVLARATRNGIYLVFMTGWVLFLAGLIWGLFF